MPLLYKGQCLLFSNLLKDRKAKRELPIFLLTNTNYNALESRIIPR